MSPSGSGANAGGSTSGRVLQRVSATGPRLDQDRITVGVAATAWLVSWLGGNLLAVAALGALGRSGTSTSSSSASAIIAPVWVTLVAALSLWVPMIVVLTGVSHRYGSGRFLTDYRLRMRPIDLLGIPIGIAAQLGLLRLVYWPLEALWPEAFGADRLENSARELYDSANGGWVIVLVAIVVVGAPVVEELVYRGLLQGAFSRCMPPILSIPVVAAWFALIHFRPVEYPGLFAFGLVAGTCAWRTGRLGMSVWAHVAFNATGLVWVATR